ncbi:hypothetical protein DENSPDRAFT_841832 [Dentipellis sp. KUC8613]|nr:hypothetical protein DENSPDRAFT_841832 [Dentipellis sp. KUC8613]
MSFFSQLCCCIRPAPENTEGEPDERSRLIQPTVDEPLPQRHANPVDQDRMKERLGVIVRSKEGKMVNIHAPLPFNLHNKALRSHHAHARMPSPRPSFDTAQSSGSGQPESEQEHENDEEGHEQEQPRRSVLGVRLVRSDESCHFSGDEDEQPAEAAPSQQPPQIQSVGSISRSWGD